MQAQGIVGKQQLSPLIASPTQPTVESAIKIKCEVFTSFYEEEIAAMEAALQWISTNTSSVQTSILIWTGSQSLCEALSWCSPRTTSISQWISFISSSTFIQWVPGHLNIPGNKLADRAVKETTTIESGTIHSTPVSCTFQVINDLVFDDPPSHGRTNQLYQHRKTSTDLQLQIINNTVV